MTMHKGWSLRRISAIFGLAGLTVLALPAAAHSASDGNPVDSARLLFGEPAIAAAPVLTGPDDGATVESFAPTLTWANPGGVTQYQLQIIPFNNDGPGVDLHIGRRDSSFQVPAPPRWYGLLPDMSYTWRLRVSDATTFAGSNDPSWGPWAERRFRTPAVISPLLVPLMPASGETVRTLTPALQWATTRFDLFYFEVQLSKDSTFTTEPARATAMVYWEFRHGGVTSPTMSYTVPGVSPLEDGAVYYWRVRPRVQGDGTPVEWSPTFNFRTDTAAPARLSVGAPAFGTAEPDPATCTIANAATSFPLTPDLTGLYVAFSYSGSGTLSQNLYYDDQPLPALPLRLPGSSTCYHWPLTSVPGRAGAGGSPMFPARFRLELWEGGRLLHRASVTVQPPAGLALGPITAGVASTGCRIPQPGTTFPAGTEELTFRFNHVGNGIFGDRLWRGGTLVESSIESVTTTAATLCTSWAPEGGFTAGTWRYELLIGDKVVQAITFMVQ